MSKPVEHSDELPFIIAVQSIIVDAQMWEASDDHQVLPQQTFSTKIGRFFVLPSCLHRCYTDMENEI